MQTESVMHDNVHTDTLSKCEQFYLKFKGNQGKEVYSLFELLKVKIFIYFKKCNTVNVAGLIFTEEDSIMGE